MTVHRRLAALPFVLALLAACGGPPAAGGGGPPPGPPPAPEVGIVTLQPRSVTLYTELPGRTAAFRLAEVRPQVDGIVQRRLFTEGAEVAEGEALYQLDAAPFRAGVARAEAAVAGAKARLAAAQLQADRVADLVRDRLVSRQQADDALAAKLTAEADVAAARAALETARIDLGYAQVRAPIAGRIGRSQVTEGALLKKLQDAPVATIAQLDPIYVDVTQSAADLLRLQQDLAAGRLAQDAAAPARVTLTLEDGTAYAEAGTLQVSEVTVDEGTGAVSLRAVFPNPRRLLLPGMFVRARVEQGTSAAALLLPQAAVTRNARGQATAYVVGTGDKVEERVVRAERAVGNEWVIAEGLAAGERVVVEGLQKVRAGAVVRPMPVP